MSKPDFLNFEVDHMTMLAEPDMYKVGYVIYRIIFGVGKEDVIYEKKKEWVKGEGEKSMTYAIKVGENKSTNSQLQNTLIAMVQPSEPGEMSSHVRDMLKGHSATAHWQHIALRTSDLLAFHKYASDRAVNFITPILRDEEEDVIQVFSGEWYLPGFKPSGLFYEFVQRNPNEELVRKTEEHNRETWFKDKTFLGLYSEKEKEYQSGQVTPFLDHALKRKILNKLEGKNIWEITDNDLAEVEELMLQYKP